MVKILVQRVYNVKITKTFGIYTDDIDKNNIKDTIKNINNGIIPNCLKDLIGADMLDEREDLDKVYEICNEYGSDIEMIDDGDMYDYTYVIIEDNNDSSMSNKVDETEMCNDSDSESESDDE